MTSAVALIPARAGSKRVPNKNVRMLGGRPLIAHTIDAAQRCGQFEAVVVSTDSDEIAAIATENGAEVPFLRPAEMATETAPDILWVEHALDALSSAGREFDVFSILRPTSPFRTPETITRAFEEFTARGESIDSIRAVQKCKEHPGKMWVLEGDSMRPFIEAPEGVPYHSRQYQDLPEVYVQNSSLEIAWTEAVTTHGTIAGERVAPFFTEGLEGFSIDYPSDWEFAESVLESQ